MSSQVAKTGARCAICSREIFEGDQIFWNQLPSGKRQVEHHGGCPMGDPIIGIRKVDRRKSPKWPLNCCLCGEMLHDGQWIKILGGGLGTKHGSPACLGVHRPEIVEAIEKANPTEMTERFADTWRGL